MCYQVSFTNSHDLYIIDLHNISLICGQTGSGPVFFYSIFLADTQYLQKHLSKAVVLILKIIAFLAINTITFTSTCSSRCFVMICCCMLSFANFYNIQQLSTCSALIIVFTCHLVLFTTTEIFLYKCGFWRNADQLRDLAKMWLVYKAICEGSSGLDERSIEEQASADHIFHIH